MPRLHRSLAVLPLLAALGVFVTGCDHSSTAPQTTPSPYAGSYQGIFGGTGINGTAAITVSGASADVVGGPVVERGGVNTVTLTLTTTTGSIITLTGTITGSTATVTSTTPPATCTITFTATGATGSCTEAGQAINLAVFVVVNGIEATLYCGTQSAGPDATVNPTATLGAVVSGANMDLLVVPPSLTPTLYTGTLTGSSVSLKSTSSLAVYGGTQTSSGAPISGTITSGGSGSWSVMTPCVEGPLMAGPNPAPVSAPAGSTTPITPAPVTISIETGGSGTLGVLAVGDPSYSTGASGWLQATLVSPTTTGGTLTFSVTPTGITTPGTYMATVQVTGSLATGSQTVTVTLTITDATAAEALWLGNADDALLYYTLGLSTTNGLPSIRTSSPYATGVTSLAVDYSANLWISSTSQGTVTELPTSNFSSGAITTKFSLAPQIYTGANPTTQPAGIVFGPAGGIYPDSGLWVADSANPAVYHYSPADLLEASPTTNKVVWVTSILVTYGNGSAPVGPTKFAGIAFDALGNLWILDQKQSRLLEVVTGGQQGGPTQVKVMYIGIDATLQPQSLAFDASGDLWISFLVQGTLYKYTRAQLNVIATTPAPVPVVQLVVSGVADSITSIAFDQSGNLWLVEAAAVNASTALAVINSNHLASATPVAADTTWAQPGSPMAIAWDPAPSTLPLANVVRRAPPRSLSRITATGARKP